MIHAPSDRATIYCLRIRECPVVFAVWSRHPALCGSSILPLEEQIAVLKARLIPDFVTRLDGLEDALPGAN
jgi:hypothetical protein